MVFFLTLIFNFIALLIFAVDFLCELHGKRNDKLHKILQLLTMVTMATTTIMLPIIETDYIKQNDPISIIQS